MGWIIQNYKWIVDLFEAVLGWIKPSSHAAPSSTLTAQGAKVINSPVASGTNISQTINSPTVNLSLPTPLFGAPGRERYEEWRELIDEIHESIEQMGYAFVPIVAHRVGDERCDYQAGIRRGNRVLRNRILIAETIQKSGLIQDWDELVQYAHSGRGPHDRWEQGSPTMGGFDVRARAFQEKLMRLARDDMDTWSGIGIPLQARESEAPRCDFWLEFSPQGSRFLLIQNTGAEPVFDAVVYIPSDGSVFKSDVINRLNNDRNWLPCTSRGNFVSLESVRKVLVETVLHASDNSDEVKNIPVLIRYRTHRQQSGECHLEIRLPLRNGIQFALPEVADERANRTRVEAKLTEAQLIGTPVEVEVVEIVTSGQQQDGGADADRKFARLAIDEAQKSVAEDGRSHPRVGAVVVKDGKVLSTAHRGELPGNHAEYVALEKKLSDEVVAGATVYTTLEPCTTRTHPKVPCAERLVERKVARVVIGMLDPNPDIRGRGVQLLNDAGIETQLFPRELTAQVEDMNREFIRSQKDRQASGKMPPIHEDQSGWPDVILECQWPSLVHESKIPGSHTVRKRPWMLRYRGPGAVYNVCVHGIDFGAYRARFPFPVPTLTDTASVHPIICRKSDGLVTTTHDLESLIHNPPSGCDVQQYAVKSDGNEGEEIRLEEFVLEVEIPVTISYDDKNGNRFKIKYLLHYDIYMEKGEMIRIGGIEKVVPK